MRLWLLFPILLPATASAASPPLRALPAPAAMVAADTQPNSPATGRPGQGALPPPAERAAAASIPVAPPSTWRRLEARSRISARRTACMRSPPGTWTSSCCSTWRRMVRPPCLMRKFGVVGLQCACSDAYHVFYNDIIVGERDSQIVATDVTNVCEHFVNYITGDGGMFENSKVCLCHIAFPRLSGLIGRPFGRHYQPPLYEGSR